MESKNNIEFVSDLRTVVARLVKKLRALSITAQQLSLTERSTLATLLKQGSMLPSELAAQEKITNQSMSQVLSNLLGRGYISRASSESDKRKVLISLTAEGERVIVQVRHERDEWLSKAIQQTCTEEEIILLKRAIAPLTKLVDFE